MPYQRERVVQKNLCTHLKIAYPEVLFASDFAAGIKLPVGLAVLQKHFKSEKGWPDVFIAQPVGEYHGLFIELKADGEQLIRSKPTTKILQGDYKVRQPGDWWDLHIEQQAEVLDHLRKLGYCAEFAVGTDQAVGLTDWYLAGAKASTLRLEVSNQGRQRFTNTESGEVF